MCKGKQRFRMLSRNGGCCSQTCEASAGCAASLVEAASIGVAAAAAMSSMSAWMPAAEASSFESTCRSTMLFVSECEDTCAMHASVQNKQSSREKPGFGLPHLRRIPCARR